MSYAHNNNRGGPRPGAGRKKKPLAEHIMDGTNATVLKIPDMTDMLDVPDISETRKAEMPPVKDYLKAEQRMGDLYAEEVFIETWNWLDKYGCADLVNPQLLEQYAMCTARWQQVEGLLSQYGFVAKREHVNSYMVAPFFTVSQGYLNQARQLWYQIYQIVVQNNSTKFSGTPEDEMEKLLSGL